ncbi:aldo/keto reductase [Pseudonocardia bannensis]|uniref:Aldo/keto reductase n=1 Tax=Pseudonocardia bannensis TaxID=630973 RepID=A0A848DG77_9PSEU|nr:aldo/keto reductase [Pseudonocardia bannensis]NMH91658.1 aldo/keto reductase [Pseudonocardia bannensis]
MSARLGIGLAAVGRPAYINAGRAADLGDRRSVTELRARTEAVLDASYAAGIRYVDTARSYGRAEEFLAGWLAAHPEIDDVEIGSKWGYRYVGDWRLDVGVHEVKDHSLAAFTAQYAQTRALLGHRLGVYHVHSATLETGVLADAALHRALARLRETGVRIGVSTSGPAQADSVRRALEVAVDGAPLFTSVQSTWNVLEPSVAPALAEAAAAGARVIVKEAVANGRLAPGGQDATPGARRAAELAAELGVPVDQLAIAAALAQPWAGWVLSGAVDPAQLASNAAAEHLVLPAAVRDELAALAEPPAAYWRARSDRAWA